MYDFYFLRKDGQRDKMIIMIIIIVQIINNNKINNSPMYDPMLLCLTLSSSNFCEITNI